MDDMKIVSANEAKQSFGQVLDAAQREPVLIQKHQRPAAVILSMKEFERLRGLNVAQFNAFCDQIGTRAQEAGLTEEELARLLG
jgi:prevent-host-death family protein